MVDSEACLALGRAGIGVGQLPRESSGDGARALGGPENQVLACTMLSPGLAQYLSCREWPHLV